MPTHPIALRISTIAAAALALGAFVAPLDAQAATVSLASKATFLHVSSDAALDAVPVALEPLGLAPGRTVRLRALGDLDQGPGGDTVVALIGAFSSTSTLLGPSLPDRVPGAIEAGSDFFTVPTFFGSQATDLAEDFAIGTPEFSEVTLVVPPGATHLFVCAYDSYYQDNSDPDGDLGVELTVVGSWTDLGLGLAGAGGGPVLAGAGTLLGGDPVTLALTGAKANSSAALFIGFGLLNAPFKGGTLVPTVNVLITGLPTGPAGTLALSAAWPAGLPSGFSIHFQAWIADATGPQSFTATNGLTAKTP
jgi:hypothetical protein